jgi:hypothetical protein
MLLPVPGSNRHNGPRRVAGRNLLTSAPADLEATGIRKYQLIQQKADWRAAGSDENRIGRTPEGRRRIGGVVGDGIARWSQL